MTSIENLLAMSDDTDAVGLTFDDAFDSVATIAAPLLRDNGLPATVFVVTDHVGGTNAWGGRPAPGLPVMPLLDWESLRRVLESGLTLGAHSRTHPDLTALDLGRARDEIAGSVERLHHETGVRPSCFAYPFGRVNRAVAEITGAVCDQAYTAELRPLGSGDSRLQLPRLDAYYFQADGRLESWGRPRWHAYVQCRALLRRIRRAVTQ